MFEKGAYCTDCPEKTTKHRVSGKVRHASTIRKCGGFVPINLPIPSEKENDRPEHEGFSKMCSPATSTQMFKKWLLIKIRPYNLQSTTSQTWPAGSTLLMKKVFLSRAKMISSLRSTAENRFGMARTCSFL